MQKRLLDISFPDDLKYSTDDDHIPLEFFIQAISSSISFDLKLGYFSSNALKVLAPSFAQFIYRGGKMRIMINHFLSENDKKVFLDDEYQISNFTLIESAVTQDLNLLANILNNSTQHFFDCLRYLIEKGRLELIPVMYKPNKMTHYKEGLFSDGSNQVVFDGSCNFTFNGLVGNAESLKIDRSWGSNPEKVSIRKWKTKFEKIFSKQHEGYIYLSPEKVIAVIQEKANDKNLQELLDDGIQLNNQILANEKINSILKQQLEQLQKEVNKDKNEPKFPYPEPFEYQLAAYTNWIKNEKKGIFAMATGTGKTVTSLNCALNIYRDEGFCRIIILVPSLDLVEQWTKEVGDFNFQSIINVSGKTNWKERLTNIKNDFQWGQSENFVIISTYQSFASEVFLRLLNGLPKDILLIADEAHNIGSVKVREAFAKVELQRRIALSATPKRKYDLEGTKIIEQFFDDEYPYCYNFSMDKAIDARRLTKYFYYPRIVRLTKKELDRYIKLSKRLLHYFNDKSNEYSKTQEAQDLLMERKRIIHKASNKLELFKEVLGELKTKNKLKYCFTYVPEGYGDIEGDEKFRFIDKMVNIVKEVSKETKVNTYLGRDKEKTNKLRGFSEGKIDMLLAMKCLDEGVDVPRTEVGIFASSTGNPRQFIQRRGRLLRTHKQKSFSYIYDMVVIPDYHALDKKTYKMERSQVKQELTRVAYFASLSEDFYYSKRQLKDVSDYYKLDIDTIINELADEK